MDLEIRTALHSLEQTIRATQGPIFTDADYGRALQAFLRVCKAMDHSDHKFRAKAVEAERIERERERASSRFSRLNDLDEILGIGEAFDD